MCSPSWLTSWEFRRRKESERSMTGGRLIAIGDVHGCSAALQAVLGAIDPQPHDTLVGLGDYVDRGPDTKGVIEILLQLALRCRLITLRGNHEVMMLQARESVAEQRFWSKFGGLEAVRSYNGALAGIPDEHWEFLAATRPVFETEQHFFIHANYDSARPIIDQPDDLAYWEHLTPNGPPPHVSGKIAVVGHTPQQNGEYLDRGHLLAIDTYCHGGGWLTALEVNARTVWQANREGVLRQR